MNFPPGCAVARPLAWRRSLLGSWAKMGGEVSSPWDLSITAPVSPAGVVPSSDDAATSALRGFGVPSV
eukprot:SAG11_NODE_1061_length_6000_cov_10.931029_4_plen_68_part_00